MPGTTYEIPLISTQIRRCMMRTITSPRRRPKSLSPKANEPPVHPLFGPSGAQHQTTNRIQREVEMPPNPSPLQTAASTEQGGTNRSSTTASIHLWDTGTPAHMR